MPDRGALRIGAVLSCLDAGLPWTAAHRDALLSLLPADGLVAARLDQDQCEPFHYVVDALLRRDTAEDREWAYGLLDAALRSPAPAGRAEALWAADHACLISRAAPGRLAPALLALLGDPEHTAAVLAVLDKLGEHAAPAAPVPATLARRPAAGDLADRALAALVKVAPEQAAPLLARHLAKRPRALAAACGFPGVRPAPRSRTRRNCSTRSVPGCLPRTWTRWSAIRAARAAADLGPGRAGAAPRAGTPPRRPGAGADRGPGPRRHRP